MTEVVTNSTAYVQSLLYAARQQAVGVSDPSAPQSDFLLALAASQQQVTDAPQIAPSEQSSLANGDGDQAANRSFASPLPTPQPKAPDVAPTTGPAKARVELSVVDINAAANAPVLRASETVKVPEAPEAPAPAPKPLTLSDLGGGPAGPAQAPVEAPTASYTGVLGPAAVVKEADLANQNIFGAAFAPTQVAQPTATATPVQSQKNFIFAQRKLFAEEAQAASQASGKFVSEDVKATAFISNVERGKFAVPAAAAGATVGAQFAAHAEVSQRLFDKVQNLPSVENSTGEVRLYDKVPQTDTQGGHDGGPGDEALDSRESLYQRAQAVAQALGEKSSNPAVKKLVATLESYAAVAGIKSSSRRGIRVTV